MSAYKIKMPGNYPEKKAYNIQNAAKVSYQELLKYTNWHMKKHVNDKNQITDMYILGKRDIVYL